IDIDIAQDMRRQAAHRVDAPALVAKADTRDAETMNDLLLPWRDLPLQPDEGAFLGKLLHDVARAHVGNSAGQKLYRFIGVDDLTRIGIEGGYGDIARQKHAVAVDDVGAGQRRFL